MVDDEEENEEDEVLNIVEYEDEKRDEEDHVLDFVEANGGDA